MKRVSPLDFRFITYLVRSNTSVKKKSAAVQMKSFQDSVATCVQLCFHCWFHPAFYYWLKILQQSPSIVTIFLTNFKHRYEGIASFITIPMANRFLQKMYHTLKKMSSLA